MILGRKYFRSILGGGTILFAILAAPVHAQTAPAQMTTVSASGAVNFLGLHVFQRLTTRKKTVLISPLNLGGVMAQLAEGARGDTRVDLLQLMGWPADASREIVGRAMQSLYAAPSWGNGSNLQMASALWVNLQAPLRASFSKLEKRDFDAMAKHIDFSKPNSVGIINSWFAAQTHGRIKHIVNSLDPSKQVALTSALYFRGLWRHPFNQKKTKPGDFTGVDGHIFKVPFMYRSGWMDYLEGPGYQAVALAFSRLNYSIVFVVPQGAAAQVPETAMRPGSAVYDPGRYEDRRVRLYLPRLKLSNSGGLLGTLRAMAAVPFGRQADYGEISPNKLVVGKLVHQVTLDLDEKGVTATAGMLSDIVPTGERVPPLPVVTLRVDRPFDFFVQSWPSNAIVMVGHVVDPGTRVAR